MSASSADAASSALRNISSTAARAQTSLFMRHPKHDAQQRAGITAESAERTAS